MEQTKTKNVGNNKYTELSFKTRENQRKTNKHR